jgi:uncharacterized protein (TIGR02391 family)
MLAVSRSLPTPHDLLGLEPEELAWYLLEALKSTGRSFNAGNVGREVAAEYKLLDDTEIGRAVMEAYAWLQRAGLICQDYSQNNWDVLTRLASRIKSKPEFDDLRKSQLLKSEMLHTRLRGPVWAAFIRGSDHYDTAVFGAFKEVEVAVRHAARLGSQWIGEALMREAFKPKKGRLTDKKLLVSEQKGLADLFSGAIECYKNPGSHRLVEFKDPKEVVGLLMLSSHLLNIVDDVVAKKPRPRASDG